MKTTRSKPLRSRRRPLAFLLCAVLLAGLMAPAVWAADTGFAAGDVQSFAVTASRAAEKDYTQTATVTDTKLIEMLAEALGEAGEQVTRPSAAVELLKITTTLGDGSTAAYALLRNGEEHYLQQGSTCRTTTYYAMENVFKRTGFFKYYDVPGATVSTGGGEIALDIVAQEYVYRNPYSSTNIMRALNLKAPVAAVPAGTSLLTPKYARKPDSVTYTVLEGDKQVWTGSAAQISGFTPKAGATYQVRIAVNYEDNGFYRGSVTYGYTIGEGGAAQGTTSGGVTITAEGSETYPGEVVVLKVTGVPQGTAVTGTSSLEVQPQFFQKDANTHVALLPVSVYVATGQHWVDVNVGGETTRLGINSQTKQFEVQHLTVAESTAEQTILSQKANEEYERVIAPLRGVADDTQHWSGRFILPASDQKVSSPFGVIRYTNGSSTPGRHNALDLALPQGTNIAAVGGGRVLYSGFLQLTGNTILIEHGYGLKSWYYHMNSLSVATGDMVAQGQVIGTVGSTGFSTGPHLHLGMSVGGVFVNPYTLINTDLLNF